MTSTATLDDAVRTIDRQRLWYLIAIAVDELPETCDYAEVNNEPELLRSRLLAAAELVRVLWMLDSPAQAMRAIRV